MLRKGGAQRDPWVRRKAYRVNNESSNVVFASTPYAKTRKIRNHVFFVFRESLEECRSATVC